ncbi:alpha/beta fold hydrolase [Lentilactobacillus parabuchneri]|uniref:Phospholipase YtpA n=3 Tax=Lentilactobacillus parabuchneri TaxID=152331 RepID=A0A1X1FBV2_9LACO|nr:alpha/beta hydrolase [Lentilactobacillus parabuchneri]APR08563.1 Phospholipase YtpA [Lentilactobacillus parabuchneri]KRM47777.1 alpha beta hydrolase fold protein [Lentilactobacillus parabuchneri DSM 5707 = NBRC 107865]KRN80202.1 alpha beta hydrolase fold protein [Lentilactobacillus parabuchneri]MBW0244925.1 alpha/beta hydrolase [Lentilactobacillus parabuchneri]MBW0263003.1 alpha/beta hydrolase [Lentilactobacillus parabuchneri]
MPLNYQLPTDNQTKLAVAVFPAENPKGIVQMMHGALEHKERYYEFADFLASHGYVVVISDNRGHGGSVSKDDPWGLMRSIPRLVDDQVLVTKFIKQKYPSLSVSLFGHSFGSILARLYLQQHDHDVNAVALTGTTNYVPIVPVGLMIGRLFLTIFPETAKWSYLSKISGLAPGDHEWLSYNPENIQKVTNDPLMMDEYPVRSLQTLWQGDFALKQTRRFECHNPNLPILSLVGADDKFSGGEKGLADTLSTLKKIGYRHVKSIREPHMKHEVLQETKRQVVFNRLLTFFERHQ